ncbi:MAG TPA: hypothetical protein VGB71_00515 [Flavisolibacter sp.]|jgi:hypothetical protein
MAKSIHKGTELNNVQETWNENERRGEETGAAGGADEPSLVSDDLQQTIKEEATAYDNANKEDRILGGDRASVDDES